MQIDRRITNGLAWAGALLVVGIPVADLLSAQLLSGRETAAQVAVIEPVAPVPAPASQRPAEQVAETAPVKPVAAPAAPAPAQVAEAKPTPNPIDPLNAYMQSGRKLPSYISDAPAETTPAATPAPAPATATTEPSRPPITAPAAPIATDPVEVASLPSDKIAPVPMPLSMRPKPVAVRAPSPSEQVVIPPSVSRSAPPVAVTARDLEDWETGPLSEFLARRQQQAEAPRDYRPGGFYLDEAPAPEVYDRYVGPVDAPIFWPFTN